MDHQTSDSQNPYASPASIDQDGSALGNDGFCGPLIEPIRISGRLSWKEYAAGADLAGQATFFSGCLLVLVFAGWFGLLLGLIVLPDFRIFSASLAALVVFGILYLLAKLAEFIKRRPLRELQRLGQGSFEHRELILSEDGLEIIAETVSSKIVWSLYGSVAISKNILVLVSVANSRAFRVIPRAHCESDRDWKRLQGLCKRKLRQNRSGKPPTATSENSAHACGSDFIPAPALLERSTGETNRPGEPLVEPLVAAGAITQDDLSLVGKMLARSEPRNERRQASAVFVVLILSVFAVWGCWLFYVFQDSMHVASLVFAASIVIFLLIITFIVHNSVRRTKRNRERQEDISTEMAALIQEDGYLYYSQQAFLECKWRAFRHYEQSEQVVLLHGHERPYFSVFLRHTFLNDADWECFLGLLDRKLPRC
jgi:hypothetical protein